MAKAGGGGKAVVLFSGGLDSTVLLAGAVASNGAERVVALSIYYGQKHDKEVGAAKAVAGYYGVEHIVLDLSSVFSFGGSTLLKGGGEIAEGDYSSQNSGGVIATYVPFRNGLMISAAASVALAFGADTLLYGAHKDDSAAAYPDCSEEFFAATAQSVFLGSGGALTLKAPFVDKRKSDIVAEGLGLRVPFELTWSCYKGEELACGKCATCIDRINAFRANKASDPLIYRSPLEAKE